MRFSTSREHESLSSSKIICCLCLSNCCLRDWTGLPEFTLKITSLISHQCIQVMTKETHITATKHLYQVALSLKGMPHLACQLNHFDLIPDWIAALLSRIDVQKIRYWAVCRKTMSDWMMKYSSSYTIALNSWYSNNQSLLWMKPP